MVPRTLNIHTYIHTHTHMLLASVTMLFKHSSSCTRRRDFSLTPSAQAIGAVQPSVILCMMLRGRRGGGLIPGGCAYQSEAQQVSAVVSPVCIYLACKTTFDAPAGFHLYILLWRHYSGSIYQLFARQFCESEDTTVDDIVLGFARSLSTNPALPKSA